MNNGYAHYNTLDVNLTHSFNRRLSMLASYTWLHATDNVDPDVPGQNPNDPNFSGRVENSNAIFDQRHRFVLSGIYIAPAGIYVGGLATLASGLPYNFTTGANNSGDGATADHPVINGVVVGRNTGRGRAIYDVSPFLEHPFGLHGDRVRLVLRAESFNVFNHANFVVYSGTWGNAATPGPGFGAPSPASPLSSRPLAAVFREGDVFESATRRRRPCASCSRAAGIGDVKPNAVLPRAEHAASRILAGPDAIRSRPQFERSYLFLTGHPRRRVEPHQTPVSDG